MMKSCCVGKSSKKIFSLVPVAGLAQCVGDVSLVHLPEEHYMSMSGSMQQLGEDKVRSQLAPMLKLYAARI